MPGRDGFVSGATLESFLERACVLIVDDEPANVALLTRLILMAGVGEVHGVTDPREAVQRCVDIGADLVLLDLHMAAMDGYEVMAALRAALPDDAFVPVLVLTADTTTATRDRALSAGAKDFLTKPLDRTEVTLRVRNLLETQAIYENLRGHYASLRQDVARRATEDQRIADEQRERATRIEQVLSGDALTMVFQPIGDLTTGDAVGTEALARFACQPQRPPDAWFDEAASIGLGAELEIAAVRTALEQLHQLPATMFMSVNVSPPTVIRPELAALLRQH